MRCACEVGLLPGHRTTPPVCRCHAVVAVHVEEIEGLTARIYNHLLGLWGGKHKKEEDWQQMLAQGQSSSQKKKPTKNT